MSDAIGEFVASAFAIVASVVFGLLIVGGIVYWSWRAVRGVVMFPLFVKRRFWPSERDIQKRTERERADEELREEERREAARDEQERATRERARQEARQRAVREYQRQVREQWPEAWDDQPDVWVEATDRYGDAHKGLRQAYKRIIAEHGAQCMETVCVMPSRQIPAAARWDAWDLAHDHASGGRFDYLGPAHKECNQAEALFRGVTWPGAPSLPELMRSVGYRGTYPNGANGPDPESPRPPKATHSPVEPPSPMTKDDPWGGLDPWA